MNIDNENITYLLNEDSNSNMNDIDIIQLQNEINEIEIGELNNEMYDKIYEEIKNYDSYNVKQLTLICEFYGIEKNKMKKQEIIEQIILFERNMENIEIVFKRKEFWNYMNELKNDKFMKRFVIW